MKKRNLLYSLLTLVSLSAIVFLINQPSGDVQNNSNSQSLTYAEQGINGAVEYYKLLKADPVTGKIDPKIVAQTKAAVSSMATSKAASMKWMEMGPDNVGGRVRAILVDKNNSSILYAGGVSGGLWKSTTAGQSWVKIPLADNIAISCIAQDGNGNIFVGTGEGLAFPGFTNVNSGMYGQGIYKSTDGNNFAILPNTTGFTLVNRIAIDKKNKIYAATSLGLKASIDGGDNWSQVKIGSYKDVKIAPNSLRVVATIGGSTMISNDEGATFFKATVPSSGVGRVEVAISPSNNDVIYAVLAGSAGDFKGIYRTTDGGTIWAQVAIGGSPSFELFGPNNQGWYDNVCMVSATDPDMVYVGGVDMWKGMKTASGAFSWTKITQWFYPPNSPHYVHADQHTYVPVPGQNNTFYAGTDGGIFKTADGGANFVTLNKNLNITQFYAVASHPAGGALAGAQDNGTIFLDFTGNSVQAGRKVSGGDGGWSASSFLNQDVIFTSVYNSSISRSADFGVTFQGPVDNTGAADFYNQAMIDASVHLSGPFVSNVILWETTNFANSMDSVFVVADTNYLVGDTLLARSVKNNRYPSYHIVNSPIIKGDTVSVMDPVQSRLIFGGLNKIYWTPEALYFVNKTPLWYVLTNVNGTVNKLRISKDGDHLFYTSNNKLYRLSGLLSCVDSSSMDVAGANYQVTNQLVFTGSTFISSIVIDPADANRVGVTLGGYSSGYKHVYYSTNATAASPNFIAKGGNLPSSLPVYAGLIPVNNSKEMVIGTEYGMMMTDDITVANPNWYSVNDGINEEVPIFMLDQQRDRLPWRQLVTYDNGTPIYTVYPGIYNYGMIYAATHGRGVFYSTQYLSVPEKPISDKVRTTSLKLYPNPVQDYATIEFKLNKVSDVNIRIYDINGRMVKESQFNQRPAGLFKQRINLNELSTGAYFMQMQAGNQKTINKFIVR